MIRLHKYYTQTRCSSQRTKSQIPEMTYSSGNSLDYSLTFSAGIDSKFSQPKQFPISGSLLKCFHIIIIYACNKIGLKSHELKFKLKEFLPL